MFDEDTALAGAGGTAGRGGFRHYRDGAARRRVHLQAWQLRQLVS